MIAPIQKILNTLLLITNYHSNENSPILYNGEENHFRSIKQLTFHGINAEAYFSRDNSRITFQAIDYGYQCDQIFKFDLTDGDMSRVKPSLISTGFGRTTCSYFFDHDMQILFASTHLAENRCPISACSPEIVDKNATLRKLCKKAGYVWDVFPDYDIFTTTDKGILQKRLTNRYGYDAEGTVSPGGDLIVYTSMASGDLELWTMRTDGSDKKQITNVLGYDGGAFFSPGGAELVFRASRPKTKREIDFYKTLLSYNLVAPTEMELYRVKVDGTKIRKITNLGGANWAPYYYPDGNRIIFSSNHENPKNFSFQLYSVDKRGSGVMQITRGGSFNSFPMFSTDGKRLIFVSNRNASIKGQMNIFLADFINNCALEFCTSMTLVLAAMIPICILQ